MYICYLKVKNNKTKSFDININNKELTEDLMKITTLLTLKYIFFPGSVFADGKAATISSNPISDGLKPLLNVLQDLAEPVSYGFMVKGFLKIMAGDENEGKKTLKNAGAGFIGIQFIPKIFRILRNINF